MDDDVDPAVRDLAEEVECWFNFVKPSMPIQGGRNIQLNMLNVEYGNQSVNLFNENHAEIN